MRSGWKRSNWSSFSPVEANRIGLPVTARTDSAAPPRASPSSLRQHDAVEVDRRGELLGDVDRVLAGHRVDDEQDWSGLDRVADRDELGHQLLVDVQAPGGVDDQHVLAVGARALERPARDLDAGRARCPARRPSAPACSPTITSCSTAAGRYTSQAASATELRCSLAQQARELRGRGRLAGALQAGHQDHRRRARREGDARRLAPPIIAVELLVDDLDDLLAGVQLADDLGAQAALRPRR